MKTATTAFKAAQRAPGAFSVRRLSFKRRYWVESTKSYAWEGSWTVLPESEVVSVSPVTAKLDTDRLNEFKISNVNLVLKNERRQWKADCRTGYFGATAGAIYGFEPYWTKFKLESGYEVGGVATYITLFVGVAVEFNAAGYSDSVQVSVQGQEALLMNANAEDIATTVTNENMGTGNGSNKDFTTVQPGVGIIVEVSLDGLKKKAGTDYTVSQMDTPTLGAKVSFTVAPGVGVVVRSTYKYWKQDQKIEEVVADLLTAAGIATLSRDVSSVLFPTGVIQQFLLDTQGDWNAGTKTVVDVNRSPGDLKLDFIDTTNKTLLDAFASLDPAWTTTGTVSITAGKLRVGAGAAGSSAYRPSTKTIGVWEIEFGWVSGSGAGPANNRAAYFFFMGGAAGTDGFGNKYLQNSYVVNVFERNTGSHTVSIGRCNSSGTITWFGVSNVATVSPRTITVGRNPGGVFSVYVNGSLIFTATDNTYTTSSNMMVMVDNNSIWDFDNLYVPGTTYTGSWVSATLDCLSTPTAWGTMQKTQTLVGSASLAYYTRSSTDGISWDSYVDIGAANQIGSALKRYLQVKVVLTCGATDADDVSVQSIIVPYTSASTRIKMPSFEGKTVYDAIQSVGAFANYEWGFREDEVFFFRPKTVDLAVDESLDSSTNLLEISSVTDGYDRVYSEVRASYGSFEAVVADDGKTKDGPRARVGKRVFSIEGGSILLNPDTDIATGVATLFYAAVSKPKRQFRVRAKLMEWLDLSDTVSLTCADNVPVRPWTYGDTSVYLGQTDIYMFGDAEQTARAVLCKVVGARHDLESKVSEFDLEEIPT
jgi:hypothetical protein